MDKLETSDVDLDLDLQGQICHENLKVFVIPCECDNFLTILNLPFKPESVLIIYIIQVPGEFETGALDLDHPDQIGLQTSTVFLKMNRFSLHLQPEVMLVLTMSGMTFSG